MKDSNFLGDNPQEARRQEESWADMLAAAAAAAADNPQYTHALARLPADLLQESAISVWGNDVELTFPLPLFFFPSLLPFLML